MPPVRLFVLRLSALVCLGSSVVSGAEKPNVLVIVADDLGYADLGFQGCKDIPTPHLDRLAAQSVRCSNGYVSHPFCSPTRAGLLTGRYQHRFGHENNPAWLPESTTEGLPLTEMTFPSLMKQVGYATGAVGKWHLGAHPRFHPNRRGFDDYFGLLGGGHVYFPEDKASEEYTIPLNRNGTDVPQTRYMTDEIGDEAAAFVTRSAGKAWMLYTAFNAPHTPLRAPQEWLEKLAGIANESRRTYAAMVAGMDAAVGRVLAALDTTGQADNTLVFFISDNGGPNLAARTGVCFTDNTPLRGYKGDLYDGGIRVPFLIRWPARLKPGVYDRPVIALDFLPTAVAAAGGELPADRTFDGVDLVPYLTGQKTGEPHQRLFWRSGGPGGKNAVREGDWKLVRTGSTAPELYDLASDIGEAQDVASKHPDRVAALTAAIAEWEKGTVPPIFQGLKAANTSAKGKGKDKGKTKAKAKTKKGQ
jgi:arylsulfatase A-like enzyme